MKFRLGGEGGIGSNESGLRAMLRGNSLGIRALVFILMLGGFLLFLKFTDIGRPTTPEGAAIDSAATIAPPASSPPAKPAPKK